MQRSLVGSEMCIRDRCRPAWGVPAAAPQAPPKPADTAAAGNGVVAALAAKTAVPPPAEGDEVAVHVDYTHLTLPTEA